MKKILFALLPAIIVCALAVGLSVYFSRGADNDNTSGGLSQPEPVPSVPEGDVSADTPNTVKIDEYWADLKAQKGEEPFTLEEIYLECADLFLKNAAITFRAGVCAQCFMIKSGFTTGPLSKTVMPECTIIADPENVSEYDVYTVFIASLENCFKESTSDPVFYTDGELSLDDVPLYGISYSTEYLKYGCKTYSEWAIHQSIAYAQIITYCDSLRIVSCEPIKYGSYDPEAGLTFVSYDPEEGVCDYKDVYESFKAAAAANGVKFTH